MPIQLTTAWDPGQYDPGQTYPRAKIVGFSWRDTYIRVTVDFGDVVDSAWVSGAAQRKEKSYTISGADYDTMVAEVSQTDEVLYAGVKRVLYAWLQTNVAELAGTIE